MPIAVVALDFDPVLRLGGVAVRLDTLVAAAGILVALLVAGALARSASEPRGFDPADASVRFDDVLFIALAAIPGALVGGRLGYALLHLDYYLANPGAIVDPGQGSLELTLAVVGAAVTAFAGARMVPGSVGGWFDVAAVPMLLALGIGKLSMAIGGAGQGAPTLADWATRYVGDRPWGSLAPDVPAHPAQLYEATGIGLVLAVLVVVGIGRLSSRRNGLAWLAALAGWAGVRVVVAATWRDAPVLGPLRAEQLIGLAVLAGAGLLAVWLVRRPVSAARPAADEPDWPDPATRPHF